MSRPWWCVFAAGAGLCAVLNASCSNPPSTVEAAAAVAPPRSAQTPAVPHGDHRPHYGGLVMMKGDLHFEVVLGRDGTHRIYFSDAVRAELPAAVASEVTLTVAGKTMPAETLRAMVDDTGESWVAKGSPLVGEDVIARVAFVVNSEPYWIDVPYAPAAP